jgi:protocatechuate 3,4-dioxygenase beta subunit
MARIFSCLFALLLALTFCACDLHESTSWAQEKGAPVSKDKSEAEKVYFQAIEAMAQNDDSSVALAKLAESFEKGLEQPSRVLADPAFERMRNDPQQRAKLRELLGKHVRESKLVMVDKDEPGERMNLEMELVDASGAPVANAIVYAYHTDAEGDYAPDAGQPGGGSDNPRLFCYLRSDSKGRVYAESVVPASYRGTDVTQHIHFHVDREGKRHYGSGIYFNTHGNLDEELRTDAEAGVIFLADLEKKDNATRVTARVRLPKD